MSNPSTISLNSSTNTTMSLVPHVSTTTPGQAPAFFVSTIVAASLLFLSPFSFSFRLGHVIVFLRNVQWIILMLRIKPQLPSINQESFSMSLNSSQPTLFPAHISTVWICWLFPRVCFLWYVLNAYVAEIRDLGQRSDNSLTLKCLEIINLEYIGKNWIWIKERTSNGMQGVLKGTCSHSWLCRYCTYENNDVYLLFQCHKKQNHWVRLRGELRVFEMRRKCPVIILK